VRVHPGRYVLEESPAYSGDLATIRALNSENLPIPMVSTDDWRIVQRLAQNAKLGKLCDSGATPSSGEIVFNESFRKYMTSQPTDTLVRRGSHIRYAIAEQAKQGEPVYLKRKLYLQDSSAESKAFDFQKPRIVYQEVAAIDNWRRVIAAYLPAGNFCGHKICYFREYKCDPMALLAVFNSTLINWLVTVQSTNNSLPGYLISSLPFPKFTPVGNRSSNLEYLLIQAYESRAGSLKEIRDREPISMARQLLLDMKPEFDRLSEQGRIQEGIHDLLARLAQRMLNLQTMRRSEINRFLSELDRLLGGVGDAALLDTFKGKTIVQNYVGDYQKGQADQPFESIWNVITNNKSGKHQYSSPGLTSKLRQLFENSVAAHEPLKVELAITDALIDRTVYFSYGLSEQEIGVIEGAKANNT
jgi:hypothetical protein